MQISNSHGGRLEYRCFFDMERFKQKVVAITGASSGIGLELALAFAKEGALVAVGARRRDLLNDVAARCREESRDQALAYTLDVTNPESSKGFVQEVIDNFGKLDVLVVNAGITMDALSYETNLKVFRELMEVNYFGALHVTLPALPHLIQSKGILVVISSITGKRAVPSRSGYCASKFALHGFYETLRLELQDKGVQVLMVCPGFTDTEIKEKRRGKEGTLVPNSVPDKYAMPANVVAQKTVQATASRKKELILSASGRFIVKLTRFCPGIADQLTLKVMRKNSQELGKT